MSVEVPSVPFVDLSNSLDEPFVNDFLTLQQEGRQQLESNEQVVGGVGVLGVGMDLEGGNVGGGSPPPASSSSTSEESVERVIELANLAWILPRWAEAFELYKSVEHRTAGDQVGHVAYRLGLLYTRGYGGKKPEDTELAQKYLELALELVPTSAKKGNCEALCDLGHMYENGNGLPCDEDVAVKYYRQAADKGYPRGQYNLAVMLQSDTTKKKTAIQFYKLAADADYPCAQYNLACMFYKDLDYDNALRFYARAADWGDSDAQRQVKKMCGGDFLKDKDTFHIQLMEFFSSEWRHYFTKFNQNLQECLIQTLLVLQNLSFSYDSCSSTCHDSSSTSTSNGSGSGGHGMPVLPELRDLISRQIVRIWPKKDLHCQHDYVERPLSLSSTKFININFSK